ELDGKLYFRVIDYKSGKKEFSLDETVNGIGMQMLLYMFALEEMGKEHFSKIPQAAGVMYVPIAREANRARGEGIKPSRREGVILRDMRIIDAMESGENKEYIPATVDKKGALKRGSVVLTSNQFEAVKARMKQILAGIGDELSRGEIEPNPYVHKGRSSCDFCEYRAVCAFDEERGGDRKRELCSVKLADIIKDGEGTEDE
ncbi:MAG: PD-(D/E)XK nuclease family protein, partial [Oscillospiraceae bacterium]|nr:PD-(D/E)XK nuclease family protein [Oscillospiraceae bacterium]